MLDFLYEAISNTLGSEEGNEFIQWIEAVAEKISSVALNLEDDNLIETILNNKTFTESDTTLYKLFREEKDIESASYKILSIIQNDKK